MDPFPSRSCTMPILNLIVVAAKLITASYKILTTLILSYYLIKDTVYKERNGRKRAFTS